MPFTKKYTTITRRRRPAKTTRSAVRKSKLVAKTPLGRRLSAFKRFKKLVVPKHIVAKVGGISESRLFRSRKPNQMVKEMKDVANSNVYVTNSAALLNQIPGHQNSVSLPTLDLDDIRTIGQSLPQNNSGSRRYVLESISNEYLFSNQSTGAVEFEIMDLALKHDMMHEWSFQANGQVYGPMTPYPENVWAYGAQADSDLSPTLPSFPQSSIIGSKPFDTAVFNTYYKPLQRNIVVLPQGGSHRHVLKLSPNQIMDETLWNVYPSNPSANNYVQAFKGLTIYTLVIAKGMPVIDRTTGAPTTGLVALSIVKAQRVKFAYVQDVSNSIRTINTLADEGGITPRIVNIGSGQPETEVIAS